MCYEGLRDPFAGQVACVCYRAERNMLAQAVQEVCEMMEAHCLGVEGMDESPVASWASALRAALGSPHCFQNSRGVAASLASHGDASDASDVTMSAHDLLPEEERYEEAQVLHLLRGRGALCRLGLNACGFFGFENVTGGNGVAEAWAGAGTIQTFFCNNKA